jgi:ribosome-associated protein
MALTLDEKTRLCAITADSKKAEGIVVLNIHPLSSVADHFLICSGLSERQAKAIADAIEEQLVQNGEKPMAIEGYQEGSWILIDCADLIIHIFDEETRRFYDLERLWGRAERVEIPEITVGTGYALSPGPLLVKER